MLQQNSSPKAEAASLLLVPPLHSNTTVLSSTFLPALPSDTPCAIGQGSWLGFAVWQRYPEEQFDQLQRPVPLPRSLTPGPAIKVSQSGLPVPPAPGPKGPA
jgi:hypothetical protein